MWKRKVIYSNILKKRQKITLFFRGVTQAGLHKSSHSEWNIGKMSNDILRVVANTVRCILVTQFSLIADGTQDISI